jgi:hypothetical protein
MSEVEGELLAMRLAADEFALQNRGKGSGVRDEVNYMQTNAKLI